jgi:hypothetical protein
MVIGFLPVNKNPTKPTTTETIDRKTEAMGQAIIANIPIHDILHSVLGLSGSRRQHLVKKKYKRLFFLMWILPFSCVKS